MKAQELHAARRAAQDLEAEVATRLAEVEERRRHEEELLDRDFHIIAHVTGTEDAMSLSSIITGNVGEILREKGMPEGTDPEETEVTNGRGQVVACVEQVPPEDFPVLLAFCFF